MGSLTEEVGSAAGWQEMVENIIRGKYGRLYAVQLYELGDKWRLLFLWVPSEKREAEL